MHDRQTTDFDTDKMTLTPYDGGSGTRLVSTGWRPIETLTPEFGERYILWNGQRRFVGWLSEEEGWYDDGDHHYDECPEDPQPTLWHPWPEEPNGR